MSEAAAGSLGSSELRLLDRWRVSTFWVLLIGYIGYYLCRANLSSAFPLLSQTFGYSNAQLGLIAFYSEIAYAVGKLINGPLADRFGGRRIFLLGMFGAIVFNLLFTLPTTLFWFIVIWCGCRYYLSMGWGGIVKIIGAWYPPERNGTVMGLISINFQFGGAVAALFTGYLVARGATWKELFTYPALVVTGILLWALLASREKPEDVVPHYKRVQSTKKAVAGFDHSEEHPPALEILWTLLRLGVFRHVLFFAFLTTFLRSIFMFWIPKLLVDIGMSNSDAILKSAIFPFLGALGTILLGYYTDHLPPNRSRAGPMVAMLICLVACLLAIAFLAKAGPQNANWIAILVGVSGFFLLGPYSMSAGCLTLDIAGPKAAGTAAGLVDGIGYFGGALAVWVTGWISDIAGWREVFFMLAAFAALSALSAFVMGRAFEAKKA